MFLPPPSLAWIFHYGTIIGRLGLSAIWSGTAPVNKYSFGKSIITTANILFVNIPVPQVKEIKHFAEWEASKITAEVIHIEYIWGKKLIGNQHPLQIAGSGQTDPVQAADGDELQKFDKHKNRRQEQQMYHICLQEEKISELKERSSSRRMPGPARENFVGQQQANPGHYPVPIMISQSGI